MAEDAAQEATTEILDDGPCKKRLRSEVSASKVSEELRTSYDQLRKSVTIPGFRPGRVPRGVLEKRFGKQILEDVREDLMRGAFEEEVEANELRVVGQPHFDHGDLQPDTPFSFEVSFEVAPTFDLPEYKGIAVDDQYAEVTEEDVDQELESLREQTAELRPIEPGEQTEDDFARADVCLRRGEGTVVERKGVHLKIGTASVDNIAVEGLTKGLLEAGLGDALVFQVVVPDDFAISEARGETLDLSVTVQGFDRRVVPEVDEEFLKSFAVESIADLRKALRGTLETRRRVQEENRQEEQIVDHIISSMTMDLPESIVKRRQEELQIGLRLRLSREGKSEEEVEAAVAEDTTTEAEARRELTQFFVLDRIAEQERVFVTEDEIAQRLVEIAPAYGKTPDELFEEYRQRGMLAELRAGMLREKVRRFLRKKAQVGVPESDESAVADATASDSEEQ